MLTATHHSYGSPRLSDFFYPAHAWRSDPSQPILTQNGSNDVDSRKDDTFAVKIATFSYPLISRAPKRSKFRKFLDLENFPFDLAFNIRCQRVNTTYSSSGPNKSGIVNRQSVGEKLKYILKFYTEGTCHVISRMRNDDLALCLWAHDVWGTISRNPLEIETWVQWTTNRK